MPPDADPNAPPTTTPTTNDPPTADPPAPSGGDPQPPSREAKVLQIPANSMGKIKREEREKGQLALAKEMGFTSVEEMKAAVANKGRGQPARRDDRNGRRDERRPSGSARQPAVREPEQPRADQPARADQPSQRTQERHARERAELEEKNRRLAREKARREKESRDLRRQLDAKDAEVELKLEAVKAGIKDADYALTLMQRQLAGRTAEELRAFDSGKFFGGLRETHPFLFGEVVRPATTGTQGSAGDKKPGAQGTQPAAQPAQPSNGGSTRMDARKLSREEFDKLLASRGLSNPSNSPSF